MAGSLDEMELMEIVNEQWGTHKQESNSAGHVFKASNLNCLGFLTAPLYRFSSFFEGKQRDGFCPVEAPQSLKRQKSHPYSGGMGDFIDASNHGEGACRISSSAQIDCERSHAEK
ncbi:MAG: DUF4277 domain-containing protein [Synechococcus sp.]